MKAIIYHTIIQFKLDFRNKDVIVVFYLVPIMFFLFMGNIFTLILADADKYLIQSMTIFSVSMGAMIGMPHPLLEVFSTDVKKAFKVGGIPYFIVVLSNFISAFIHLMIMSIIIYIVAPILFNAQIPSNILRHFMLLAICIVGSLCIGMLLGLFTKSVSKLTMYSQILFLPSIMLSGIMFPNEILPDALQKIGLLFPATWGYGLLVNDNISKSIIMIIVITIIGSTIICAFRLKKLEYK